MPDDLCRRLPEYRIASPTSQSGARAVSPIDAFHDLCHSVAMWLIQDGWDVTAVAQHLGHRVETLQRTYTHELAKRPHRRDNINALAASTRGTEVATLASKVHDDSAATD